MTTLRAAVALALLPCACVVTGVEGGFGDAPEFSEGSGVAGTGGPGGAGGTDPGGSAGTGGGGSGGSAGAGGAAGSGGTAGSGGSGCDPACATAHCGDCDGDPSNGCETRLDAAEHCGACGRSCGEATCSSAGACSPASVVGGGRVHGLASGAAGVGFSLRRFSPPSFSVMLIAGPAPTALASPAGLSEFDRVVVGSSDVFYSSSGGVFEVPVSGGAQRDVRNGTVHLAGADASHVYAARLTTQQPPVLLERVDRATRAGVFHCTDSYQDGALEPAGTLLVAKASGLFRYDFGGAGTACAGEAGVSVATGDVRRVVATATSIYFVVSSGAAGELWQQPVPSGAPSSLGAVASFAPNVVALATLGDRPLFSESATGADGTPYVFVSIVDASGARRRLAALAGAPTALAADATHVYVGTEGYLGRVPVP